MLLPANIPRCAIGVCSVDFQCLWPTTGPAAKTTSDAESSVESSSTTAQAGSTAMLGLVGLVGLAGLIPLIGYFIIQRRSHTQLRDIEVMQMQLSTSNSQPMNTLASPGTSTVPARSPDVLPSPFGV